MFGVSVADKAPPLSGAEMMLKSMGLGDVIVAAKAFANDQTMQKIMAFANSVEPLAEAIARIDKRLDGIETRLGIVGLASGSGSLDSGPGGLSSGDHDGSFVEHGTA